MRIAKVQGTVTLSRCHATFDGARLRLATPLTLGELPEGDDPSGETLVVWDELGAGIGSLIAVSEGGEAAQPFRPAVKPVDAYCAAILDDLNL
ncbi:Ethanolamine utilization protein EutN/carboxysome [Pirellulimonas nuda]|uniref:Ethanolamine utilization protein EutN/carboxysome n=1 Tax=Pirellulimonas nuda TaxID=2528009 RepID=A0A518DGM7_9BACT|nr:EutN/CcmL family microcompartment protein [Pirellulimonas nuda]QDU90625.1 Ethanolamine utilization protein EutN/carboxysome [Pirellulimonas nuda]